MALAISLNLRPEVLAMIPVCRRHRMEMVERGQGLWRCPINGCECSYDEPAEVAPPSGGSRPDACPVKLTPMPPNALVERAFGFQAGYVVPEAKWQRHLQQLAEREPMRLHGPLPTVPQCNASPEYSCMNGPAAPGGGSKSSGRKRKKGKGGKKFTDGEWWGDGATNNRK